MASFFFGTRQQFFNLLKDKNVNAKGDNIHTLLCFTYSHEQVCSIVTVFFLLTEFE